MKRTLLIFALLICTAAVRAGTYNVRDFGATGNGTDIDSPAINRAIEVAAAGGGGTVYFPAGTYASYSIRLQSNITLYLDNGAVILAAYPTQTEGYDAPEPNDYNMYQDFGHSHFKNSLIWGIGLDRIAIRGDGTIDGLGLT